jgi:hypothetical protein
VVSRQDTPEWIRAAAEGRQPQAAAGTEEERAQAARDAVKIAGRRLKPATLARLVENVDTAQLLDQHGHVRPDRVQRLVSGAEMLAKTPGLVEAERRFGQPRETAKAGPSTGKRGAAGHAEALRRFGRPSGDDAA